MPNRAATKRKPDALRVAGAGVDIETATWSCLGEAIERYSAGWHDPNELFYGTMAQLPSSDVLSPDDFVMFADDQFEQADFKFPRFSNESPLKWKMVERLRDGKQFWAPACLIYFELDLESKIDWHAPGISTGLACGPTKEWAISTGIRELIERDGFCLHWLTKRPPPAISIESLEGRIDHRVFSLLQSEYSESFIRDITSEIGVPTILTVTKPKYGGGIALGASTHLDFYSAIERSIVESFHTYNWVIDIDRWSDGYIEEKDISSFKDHVEYFLDPRRSELLDFLLTQNEPQIEIEYNPTHVGEMSHSDQIATMSSHLSEHGHELYSVDITSPDVRDLGLCVNRVICPSLQPLWAGSKYIFEDRRRVDQFLQSFNLPVDTPLNHTPHPFP